jgi:hypothetical protein
LRQRIQDAEEKLARTMPEPAARERQAQLNTEAELLERFDLLKFVCQLRSFKWSEQGPVWKVFQPVMYWDEVNIAMFWMEL